MADKYTPDTVDIQNAWLAAVPVRRVGDRIVRTQSLEERLAEFDRWMDLVREGEES